MKNTMSNYLHNAVMLNANTRLTFEGRMWLPGILDCNARVQSIITSRQVGKSSNIASGGLGRISKIKGYRILYVGPEHDHTKKYSQDKLEPILKSSPHISRTIDKSGTNNKLEKSFHEDGRYYLKYAKHNPDSCRGLTVDEVDYDEVQEMDLEEISPVIEESLFTSKFKKRIRAGTPKSFSNSAHKVFMESNQSEWLVKCEGCNKYNNLGIKNIGKLGPICSKCGKYLDTDNGVWVAHNPSSDIYGFHVNQLHCKISHETEDDWKEILKKLEKYPDYRFKNEVLGVSADTDEQPITESILYKSSNPNRKNGINGINTKILMNPIYAGIDWSNGGQYATSITIGTFVGGKFKYLYMRKYYGKLAEPDHCIPDMVDAIAAFQCKRVHCDHGAGFALNRDLAKQIHARTGVEGIVTANYWSGNAKSKDASWDMKNKIPTLTLNKSNFIAEYIMDLKQDKFEFFRWEDFHPEFTKDFLNVRQEDVDGDVNQTVRFNRAGPDDAFQSSVYAYIIALVDKNSSY